MPELPALFHVHAGATLAMFGLIWFVQIVHYPLMARVGSEGFSAYELAHTKRTTLVVAPLMLVEFGSALWIVLQAPSWASRVGIACLAMIWLSTFALQVPAHRVLERGFDPRAHRRLVVTNWIRTVLWSMRAVLALTLI